MRIDVFAVEDAAAQVCWDGSSGGELTLEAGPSVRTAIVDGPGGMILDGLPSGTELELVASGPGRSGRRRVATFVTLAAPPGALLSRLATVNDLHIGAHFFGTLHPLWDDGSGEPHALRCARAALAEARAWGAGVLVAKGDLTQDGRPEEWRQAGGLLGSCGMAAVAVEGNHDVKTWAVDGRSILAESGVPLHQRPAAVDLPGVRLVLFPSAAWHVDHGRVDIEHRKAAVELVAAARGPAIVAMHHYPQRFRWPTMYPTGIPGPQAAAFLDALAEANPATLVVTGHSHRHRRHHHGPLTVAEVGSTKDYPGSWAGYAVHEGGIRQVTMRVMAPAAMAWTEQGRRVLGGAWAVWGPGVRSHRCFTHVWATR
jgi:3',5'-cyclic-AMP phosphodiesterase